MATPDRDTVYTNDGTTNRSVYTRESSSTGWFVGIIVALALLAIGYLVFSANSGPTTTVDNTTTTLEAPVTPAPMTEAPTVTETAPAIDVAPMTEAPAATDATPAVDAPAAEPMAPVTEPAAPATTVQ